MEEAAFKLSSRGWIYFIANFILSVRGLLPFGLGTEKSKETLPKKFFVPSPPGA